MSTSCSGNGMAFFAANFMLQQPHNNDAAHDHHHPPSCSTSTCLSSLLPSCSAAHHQDFHGAGMGMAGLGKRSMSSFPTGTGLDMCDDEHEEHQNPAANGGGGGDEDLSDDGSLQLVGGEKKRRLNMEQVRTLEKNFELGNKLEPERKMQLAKALGLQPRQIAIWFQNRRARWKTKQLEKDYDTLKKRFDALKSDNDALHSENQKLQAEIVALKNNKEPTESINLNKENTEGSSSNRSENSSQEIKLEISRTPAAAAAAVAAPYLDDQYRSRHSPLSAAPASALHHHQPTSSMPLFPPSSSSPTGLANINRHINAGGPHHPHRLYMTMATHEEQRTFQGATTVRPDVDQADRFDNHHHHHHHQSAAAAVHVKEENATITNNNSFSNMFVSMVDDQSGFWPWLEQHNFN